MTAWHTRPDRCSEAAIRNTAATLSPALLFSKWHAYDNGANSPDLTTREARSPFLEEVSRRSNSLSAGADYREWHDRYRTALLGCRGRLTTLRATTVWRLVAGLGSNPAFEAGLYLHPLYGFPLLPGSGVRGLVRHVAEHGLVASPERQAWLAAGHNPAAGDRDAILAFLKEAEIVRALLGGLSVEPLRLPEEPEPLGWTTPRMLLARWAKRPDAGGLPDELADLRPRVRRLLGEPTGGMVSFYDAVPAPDQQDLLQIDLVNPHYPDYYEAGGHPPSDDQDPRPVTFLAVRPDAAFDFAFRLGPLPHAEPRDAQERERAEALAGLTPADLEAKISGWLKEGLTTWGAGGKTAAGYGYMTIPETAAPADQPAAATPARVTVPWQKRLDPVSHSSASNLVPALLADLSGTDRREAAQALIARLDRRWLRQREDQAWVQELLAAAK